MDDVVGMLRARKQQLEASLAAIDAAIAALDVETAMKQTAEALTRGRKKTQSRQRKMTAAGRSAISKAAKKRWAAFRRGKRG